MTDAADEGFSYFYRTLYSEDFESCLDVVRPLIIPRDEFYSLPPHAPECEYLVGIYGVVPVEGDYELQLTRRVDERSSRTIRAATPREVLDYLRANPNLPSPEGWDGDPGRFYAVLHRWLEILVDDDVQLVN